MKPLVLALVTFGALAVAGQTRRQVSLVVVGGTVITENAAHRIFTPGAVAISGTDIVDVDTPAAIAAKYQAAETIDAREQVILPGLINTHTHAPLVMYRGLADDLALREWLAEHILPAEADGLSPGIVDRRVRFLPGGM